MSILQSVILALIQGITEFLPISSSAHLILPKELFAWPDQGLAFDVAVHLGSLGAVLTYFRKDVIALIRGWFVSLRFGKQALHSEAGTAAAGNPDGKLAWCIVIATLPAAVMGLIFGDFVEARLRSTEVIAATTIIFALLLWWADIKGHERRALTTMTLKLALIIGFAQALALIPGTSRSGITITAALLLGFGRVDAARFSFLLAIPVILLSGLYMSWQLLSVEIDWSMLLTGILVSAISAYMCIHYFLGFINRIGMLPFVVYRLILGFTLLALLLAQ